MHNKSNLNIKGKQLQVVNSHISRYSEKRGIKIIFYIWF